MPSPTEMALGAVVGVGGVALYYMSKPKPNTEPVTLFYYFKMGFSGRAEGPMLMLEDAGVPYTCSSEVSEPKSADPACFAPPFCKDSSGYISQSTAICQHLGVKLGLAGAPSELGREMRATLNGEDFWGECYRPIKGGKDAPAGVTFATSERFTKWLVTLQGPLTSGGKPFLFGSSPTFADYHLLATLRAVEGMYPKTLAAAMSGAELAALKAWFERMLARPKIAAFIKSERCLPLLYPSAMNLD